MRSRTWSAVVLVGLTTGLFATPAVVHADGAGGRKLSETELRRLESRLLGRAHARDHRLARLTERRERARWKKLSPRHRRRALRPVARASADVDLASVGRWSTPFKMPVVGVHSAVLPTGKVMIFSQEVHDYKTRAAAAYLWDPTKNPGAPGEFKAVPPGDNIFCAGQSLMADGQLLVTGGNLRYATATTGFAGLKSVFTFDPWSESWTRQPDMARGRWYPTQTLLPDGRTLITSGYDESDGYVWNTDIDVFNPPAARGGQGSLTRIARYGQLAGAPTTPHWYPHWFVMPSGGVLNAGFTRRESWLLNPTPGSVTGSDRPDWSMTRKYGSAVLLPGSASGSTRVMQLGGYDHSTTEKASVASTEIFDEATPTRAPFAGPSMRVARSSHNTVLLPDSSLLNLGGGYGAQPGTASDENVNNVEAAAGPEHKAVEILDAGSDTWRLGPSQVYKRAYHSTAVLLPDGRVLSAGDDRDPVRGTDYRMNDRAEVYEPAYLFKEGPRPSITSAPAGIDFGQTFDIGTSSAVTKAVLVAPGTTTHANDMGQRLVPLTMTPRADGSGATVTAPANANIAPPGYYMLFGLSPTGKPSVAEWVYVGESRADVPAPVVAPVATPNPTPQPSSTPAPVQPSPSPPAPAPSPDPVASAPVASSPGPVAPVPVQASPSPSTPVVPAAQDVVSPRFALRTPSTVRDLRRRGRLTLSLRLDEAGDTRLSAVIVNGRKKLVRLPRDGSVRLAFSRARTRAVVLRLTRAERRRLGRGALTAKVRVRATDRSGNSTSRTVVLTLPRR